MRKLKRLWSAFACLVLALSLCIFEVIYATSASDELYGIVSQARREFDCGSGDIKKTVKSIDKAKKAWEEREAIMNMFLYHDNVDRIGVELECAKSLAKCGNEEADARLLEVLDNLATIKKSEQPVVENIF